MSEILAITVPLFVLIGLGYASVRSGLFGAPEMRALGSFVLYVALPALIVRAFGQRALGEMVVPNYLLAYGAGSLAVFATGLLAMRLLRQPAAAGAIAAMGMSCSNTGYFGYPLAALVIGPPAAAAMAMNMLVENLLVIPLGLALAEGASSGADGWRAALRETAARLLRSPLILALAAGVLLSVSGLHLPLPLARSIDMLAVASGPLALFVIGGLLHGTAVRGMAGPLLLIVAGKLVLHPLAVALALWAFPVAEPALALAAVLMAGVPMIAIFPVLGQRFGQDRLCAAALLCAVLAAFVTLTGLLAWLRS